MKGANFRLRAESDGSAAVRAEVRAWLEANWSVDYGLVAWRNKLIDSGWGVPSWPKDWFGRELPMALEAVVEDEFKRVGAVGVAKTGIRRLAAAELLLQPLVDTGLGELSRHTDTVIDSAIIGRAMIHDANPA